MITFNQFASFLKEEGVYEEFFNYMRTLGNKANSTRSDEEIFENILDKSLAISGGFIWDNTEEGHGYWKGIGDRYREYYDCLEKRNKVDIYEFIDGNVEKCRVKIPTNATVTQKGFIKSWIRERYPDVRVIKEDENYISGFSADWKIVKK